MENNNMELQDIDVIQESVQRLLHRVKNEHDHTNQFSPSIYMAPRLLRDLSPSSFNPQLVSIGPLHREDENVQAFEGQKASYLSNLMHRINSPQEEILKSCMQKAYASMNKIKACYVWTKIYSDTKIAEMMVMDACFILQFMVEIHSFSSLESILGKRFQWATVMHDLVLLENQIPLFFLDEIFQCTVSKFTSDLSLIKFIHPLLFGHNLFQTNLEFKNISISPTDHILSILHQHYAPPENTKRHRITSRIHSAVELDRAGVNFKPAKDPTWLMGLEVKQHRLPWFFGSMSKPILTMPVLKVDDETEFLLRNLIAYEQSFDTFSYVTSYASAMDMLINTQEDVAMLMESKVLVNVMGSNEEAANMINNICKHTPFDSFYEDEWQKLNNYCNGYWPKHIAWLKRTYFNSPWNIIALVVGIVLFILQVIQTIFTVKPPGSKN